MGVSVLNGLIGLGDFLLNVSDGLLSFLNNDIFTIWDYSYSIGDFLMGPGLIALVCLIVIKAVISCLIGGIKSFADLGAKLGGIFFP